MVEDFPTTQDVEPERYELHEPSRYRFALDRRRFLGVAGAGLMLTATSGAAQRGTGEDSGPSVSARLHLSPDGRITVMTGKVEVGQGSRAQLSQAAAEELRVPVEQIDLIMADTALTPDDGSTSGSRTTPSTVPAVRKAAAAAREILRNLAGRQWNVDPDSLRVEEGSVIDARGKRRLRYADLAASGSLDGALAQAVPADVQVQPVESWKVLGTSVRRPNGRDLVTGKHRYPSDIVPPRMLYGKVLRPPRYGAVLESIDLSPAREMAGVTVVRDGNFVGCVAATSYRAQQALEALEATAKWSHPGDYPSSRDLFSYLKTHAVTEASGRRGPRVRREGSPEEVLAAARQVHSAAYQVAYIQHAPLEPRAAVAEWEGDRLTVWTGTQRPTGVRQELARAFHLPEERVRVIVPDTGGAFGGKHTGEAAVEAARLARAAGRPVSLRWTREEEFTWAYFRPAGLMEIRSAQDPEGRLLAWEFINYNSGASALESPYQIPHRREEFRYCDSPLREGSYRVLAATANNFARESFMDELAAAAGKDPLEYRLSHLADPRLRAVLEAAAGRFRWEERRKNRRPHRGVGLACGTEKGSYVAACVEVEVDPKAGALRILHLCHAFECGAIQNPDNLRAQVEGCTVMTLGGTLLEEIRSEEGRILNPRFSQYPVPRFRDVPPLETLLLDRPDLPSAGAGETPMIAVPAAVANALFDAGAPRLRSLPLNLQSLRES